MSDENLDEEVLIRVDRDLRNPNVRELSRTVLKSGPQAYKVAALLRFGRPGTDRVSKSTLACRTYHRKKLEGNGFDFDAASNKWSCDDEEIEKLRRFLTAKVDEPGEYKLVDVHSAVGRLVEELSQHPLDSTAMRQLVDQLAGDTGFLEALGDSEVASLVASGIELRRHREVHQQLRELVVDANTSEAQLQQLLEREWWLFGGRYVRRLERRQLTSMDQMDLILEQTDGGIHVVELKKANVPHAVVKQRNHPSVGAEVNLAVNQLMNYIRQLDRQEDILRSDFGIDCRRVHGTLVIGHPQHNSSSEVSLEQFHQTYRSYNSYMSRIEVISYEQLLATAENDVKVLDRKVERCSTRQSNDEFPSDVVIGVDDRNWHPPEPWDAPIYDDEVRT